LVIAKELAYQNQEKKKSEPKSWYCLQRISLTKSGKRKRAEELVIANVKEKRAAIIAIKELTFQNQRKKKRAEELVIAN
jgi:hypothetical protein